MEQIKGKGNIVPIFRIKSTARFEEKSTDRNGHHSNMLIQNSNINNFNPSEVDPIDDTGHSIFPFHLTEGFPFP